MSEPEKHHYVPKVYLKRFSIDKSGAIYELNNLRSSYESKIKLTNVSKVCYEHKMYQLETEEASNSNNVSDKNIIEKRLFPYERDELSLLFGKIENKYLLSSNELRRILAILIDIKLRNIKVLKEFESNEKLETFYKPLYDEMRSELEKENYSETQIANAINELHQKNIDKLDRKEFRRDTYRNNFLKNDPLTVKGMDELIEYLYKWEFYVYSTGPRNPFITSDNPGYNLKYPNEIYNTNYYEVDEIVMPLSFKSILCLKRNARSSHKVVNYRTIAMDEVYRQNTSLMNNCNGSIFSGFNDQLEILKAAINHSK